MEPGSFGSLLKQVRERSGLSIAAVAERSETSRAAISAYEAGRKQPQFDTASRILAALGERITIEPAAPDNLLRWGVPSQLLEILNNERTDVARAMKRAQYLVATVLESDASIERLGFSFGEVKTVIDGITIAGPPLTVARLWALRDEIFATLHAAATGQSAGLRAVGSYLVEADPELPDGHRELDFLARATESGADPARVRHLVAASLVANGYPYLWVPYRLIAEYEKAVIACRRTGEAGTLVSVLLESAKVRRSEE